MAETQKKAETKDTASTAKDGKKGKAEAKSEPTAMQRGTATINNATDLVNALKEVLGAANDLYDSFKPILESEEAQRLASKTKDAVLQSMRTATDLMDAHAEAKDARKSAKECKLAAKAEKQALKDEAKAAKELEKYRKEAKQTLLANAHTALSYKAFVKQRGETAALANALGTGLFNVSACFVIATYPKIDLDDDLTDYTGVYVGCGLNVGDAIEQACSRAGNPDVYADVKFNQNMTLYFYPCVAEELEYKQEQIVALLEADASYNAPLGCEG